MTGCYLFSHKVKLPEWGFEQQEVSRDNFHLSAVDLIFEAETAGDVQ